MREGSFKIQRKQCQSGVPSTPRHQLRQPFLSSSSRSWSQMTQWWHFVFSISGYKFSSVRLLLSLLWAFCLIFLNFPPGVISKDSKPLASIIYFLQHKSFWTVSPPFFLHKWILSYYLWACQVVPCGGSRSSAIFQLSWGPLWSKNTCPPFFSHD